MNYNNPSPFAQNRHGKLDVKPLLWIAWGKTRAVAGNGIFVRRGCQADDIPLTCPFRIVSAQRFTPNQYAISR